MPPIASVSNRPGYVPVDLPPAGPPTAAEAEQADAIERAAPDALGPSRNAEAQRLAPALFLSAAGQHELAAMKAAPAWDYDALRAAIDRAPASERQELMRLFEADPKGAHLMGTAMGTLLELRAAGPFPEPTDEDGLRLAAQRLCPGVDPKTVIFPEGGEPYACLDRQLTAASRVAHELAATANRLDAANDPRAAFARVYQHVTEREIEHATQRRPGDQTPWFGLACVKPFADLYAKNLAADDAHRGEAPPTGPEPHWAAAFAEVRSAVAGDLAKHNPIAAVKDALTPCMVAHVKGDLPRGIAQAYRELWPNAVVPLESLRSSFRSMADDDGVFDRASKDFTRDVARQNRVAGIVMESTPKAVQDATLEHGEALRRAGRIAGHVSPLAGLAADVALPNGHSVFAMNDARARAFDDAKRAVGES